ncbi:MAG: hypothetical protein LBQ27_06510 [Clostridiales bacterium]|jgi:hypothetical protein|nr:hypothetical protein [Clostridiales bacterium]
MANKKSTITANDIIKWSAYVALILSAILFLIGNLANLGILGLLKDLALFAAVALAAYKFAKSKGKIWYISFWIALVIALVGLILGGINIL